MWYSGQMILRFDLGRGFGTSNNETLVEISRPNDHISRPDIGMLHHNHSPCQSKIRIWISEDTGRERVAQFEIQCRRGPYTCH